MNILYLVNELLQVCGITKHLYHLVGGLQKYYPKNEYFIMTGGGNAIQKFQSLDVPVIINENLRHETRSITGYLKGIKEVYSFVKRNDIQIIHSHHHYSSSIASKVVKFTNTKTILTNHGLLPAVGRLNHFNADHIIAVNEHVIEYLINEKIKTKEEIFLIRSGFPLPSCQEKYNSRLKVITGGRFVHEKGFHLYIRTVANLDKEVRNSAEFYLAGSGPEEKYLMELSNNLKANIVFLGPVENFQEKLCETDIFVNPSLSKAEGFPTVLIEAGLAKNLIISSQFRGHDTILNSVNSLLFYPEKEDNLKDRLTESIKNFKGYSGMIDKYYLSVVKHFNLEDMIIKTDKLYSTLAKRI